MTKIGYISDLHGTLSNAVPCEQQIDVLVLAGDIFTLPENACSFIERIDQIFEISDDVPILFILGNHECYDTTIDKAIADYREAISSTYSNVHVLEKEMIFINDIKFFGATLWSDLSNPIDAWAVQNGLNDFAFIHENNDPLLRTPQPLSPRTYHRRWQETVYWLDNVLNRNGKKVVITHHSPSSITIPPQFKTSQICKAYHSNMEDLIITHSPDLWIYGHDHVSAEHIFANTKLVSNQAGYTHQRNEQVKIKVEEI